jgi:hypothetical protein
MSDNYEYYNIETDNIGLSGQKVLVLNCKKSCSFWEHPDEGGVCIDTLGNDVIPYDKIPILIEFFQRVKLAYDLKQDASHVERPEHDVDDPNFIPF